MLGCDRKCISFCRLKSESFKNTAVELLIQIEGKLPGEGDPHLLPEPVRLPGEGFGHRGLLPSPVTVG